LGLIALASLVALVRARLYLSRTPFGLEREWALRRQNRALAVLTVLVLSAVALYLSDQVLLPRVRAANATQSAPLLPTPTPTAITGGGQVVVDSSGCENPAATLTAPRPDERIVGAFEVKGTANIPNFAFYKFEISGAGTRGEWLSLGVGTTPVVEGNLGSFDATAREPGAYAFRLVVLDNAGNFPAPCVVPVVIAGSAPP
jgi:hypothetical protein